ncbi:MAG: hypothetical protein HY321_02660 [Armatimonadetes bacterium]|nr:hypothetical protein [Armatimonadota bacterium]
MPDTDRIVLQGAESAAVDMVVRRLAEADIPGQFLRREGRMRDLGTEAGDVKLDWVDGVEKALQHPEWLAEAEAEAAQIVRQGVRHVIWSGMGGSVQTVYALKGMGFLDTPEMAIFPLDSTDAASLNRTLLAIAGRERVTLPRRSPAPDDMRRVLARTLMIGVSMGMTSEEPITHLEWFDRLLHEYGIPDPGAHIQVMTLPGSYLDDFARPRGSRMVPIQLDAENHTPGRMSAPATRVFIRPAALVLMAAALADRPDLTPDGESLRRILARAQVLYGVSHALSSDERQALALMDPWVRLGAYVAEAARGGRNKVFLVLPPEWAAIAPWVEQVAEESLGKGGKGFLIFYGEPVRRPKQYGDDTIFLQVCPSNLPEPDADAVDALRAARKPVLKLEIPLDAVEGVPVGLPEAAALFLGMKIAVATFGYLHDIVFVGQPAVEAYKKYARDFRDTPGDVTFGTEPQHTARFRSLTLNYESLLKKNLISWGDLQTAVGRLDGDIADAADVYAAILVLARRAKRLGYLDFTFNGELADAAREVFIRARHGLGAEHLRVPAKIRTGPSDYHSTEQSETDGPDELVSLRLVALKHSEPIAGSYSDKFLLAQARGTWQAMEDANRWILMMTFPELTADVVADLDAFFGNVGRRLPV